MKRKQAADNRWDLRYGVVASTIINMTYRGKNAKSVAPDDVFPHLKPKRKTQTPEQMMAVLDRAFGLGST